MQFVWQVVCALLISNGDMPVSAEMHRGVPLYTATKHTVNALAASGTNCTRPLLDKLQGVDCRFFAFNLLLCRVCSKTNSELAEVLRRPIRALTFPEESASGLFVALAVPLPDPFKSISLANFFEASYQLPTNATEELLWTETELARKRRRARSSLDRATVYLVLENKFTSYGYQGHECLLRAICETSEHTLRHNGLIGDILHVILTPTSSRHEQLPQDILQAEVVGRNGGCSKYQPQCPVGLFDLIGVLG